MNVRDYLVIAVETNSSPYDPLRREMLRVLSIMNELDYVDVFPKVPTIKSYKCEGDVGECAICQEKMKIGEMIKPLPCSDTRSHTFHTECIDMWLRTSRTCPMCRASV